MNVVHVIQPAGFAVRAGLRASFDADEVVAVREVGGCGGITPDYVEIKLGRGGVVGGTVYAVDSYASVLRLIGWPLPKGG